MTRLLQRQNLSSFVHVRVSFLHPCLLLFTADDLSETRKTYRALFSEPKVVIPGCSAVESAEPGSAVERKLLGEGLVEAAPAEGAVEALEGRKKKRARDGVELADSSTTEGSRKKRKGKKQGKID
jgi:hypothetical protein